MNKKPKDKIYRKPLSKEEFVKMAKNMITEGLETPRNPKRIEKILRTLLELWLLNPDYRLGQLIENCGINFFTEDDKVLINLENHIKANGCQHPGVFRGEKCDSCGT